MVASERYDRDVRRALKAAEGLPAETSLARIGPVFLTYVGHVPTRLGEEILAWYVDCLVTGDPRFPDPHAVAARLSAVVDIFDRAYDAVRSPLDDDEWDLVRTLVNEHSPDMKLDILEYIMQILMDRGDIG
jgi:hypothetical protein